jgi:hypothetical protein
MVPHRADFVTWRIQRRREPGFGLILRSALRRASRRMAAGPYVAAILRDAAKEPLLRMRTELEFRRKFQTAI